MMTPIDEKTRQSYASLRRLSTVPRWTVIPTIQNQNVAEHSFHVAWISRWLTELLGLHLRSDAFLVIATALLHDHDEAVTGDIPSTGKEDNNTGSLEDSIVKVADALEAALFLREELQMGNSRVGAVVWHVEQKGERRVQHLRTLIEVPVPSFITLENELLKMCKPTEHPSMMP